MKKFIKNLNRIIDKSRIIDDPLLCYAYATDASMYRMVPQLVIFVETPAEVRQIIILANTDHIPITFRAAGTSLCGQAVTDQVLVILSNNAWQHYTIHNHGQQITLEPGIIGAHANLFLKPHNTKIGPDPASINSCKIGGIVANNSSGMCCGTAQNTYQTMQSLKLILANGSTLDTGDQISRQQFMQNNPDLIAGIKQLYNQVQDNHELVKLIRHKFKIKNTTGYSLNAFTDYTDPIDILAHLMIGSEGTLGFIGEITYNCVVNNPYTAVSLIFCDNLEQIIQLTLDFRNTAIDAIELLDITSLISLKTAAKNIHYLPNILAADTSAMLVEISADTATELTRKVAELQLTIDKHPISHQIKFSTDNIIRQELWEMRKGILPIIGSNRPSTSTVVIEDVAVAITNLPGLINQLRKLFIRYNYTNAAIVGHILAGNIHFIFTPSLNTPEEINNYDQFMQEVSHLVAVTYQGSLKAEHGCGRNMAAFVELEWGQAAYKLMWQIKQLFDPNNILNPGVILNHDPKIHIKNLKQINAANPIIDKCIECGFCESVCPAKKLTFTPRQRISSYRYIHNLKTSNKRLYKKYLKQYQYYGIDTCATTNLCADKCPVNIETGKFILELKQRPDTLFNNLWTHNFNWFIQFNRRLVSLSNLAGNLLGRKPTAKLSNTIHKIIPIIPVYPETMPNAQNAVFSDTHTISAKKILYIPSCNNRIFADNTPNSPNSVQRLLEYLGYSVIYPEQLQDLCCGQVFNSAGNQSLGLNKQQQLKQIIYDSQYLVLIDTSSCFYHMIGIVAQLTTLSEILYNNLELLQIKTKYNRLAIHIDCSTKKLGHEVQILHLLSHFANELVIPHAVNCCGFAGRLGFTTPELNQSALSTLAEQISHCDIGVTFNRNCQIGLSNHGQKLYLSLAEIILNCL